MCVVQNPSPYSLCYAQYYTMIQSVSAANRIKELMAGKDDVIGLRISVKRRKSLNNHNCV